ncbi:AraC family transcriptional regulator [Georgenia sp. TF02-10]|uniref:AraC family transcriptional regulator n=1 Tax=Georgenia sp. TF02-10 TaxID=2917725 RepID=UPI001FA6FF61|nr:AraC family transcriptional regulator [Georgenia sp. TF02-10]UNX56163.1 AraC family transcriptional regulator [Georgenia sp. TF02-10]
MSHPTEHMDDPLVRPDPAWAAEHKRDGFPGQRMRVLPRPLLEQARRRPATSQLLVTDVGFFPRALRHGRSRPRGAGQSIVIVCVAGQGVCSLRSGRHRVTQGHALVLPPGEPHGYEADPADPWTIWWMHVVGDAVPGLLAATGASAARPVVRLGDPPRVVSLLNTVLRRMEHDETTSSLVAAAGAAWHALALVAAYRRAPAPGGSDPVESVLEYLRANLSERISVPELAEMAGLSQSHFAARFRRATGFGVLEYQTRLRMAEARELLDTTDRSVSSIAAQVGYSDPLYFTRQFGRIHSVSPSAYRRGHGAEAPSRDGAPAGP